MLITAFINYAAFGYFSNIKLFLVYFWNVIEFVGFSARGPVREERSGGDED